MKIFEAIEKKRLQKKADEIKREYELKKEREHIINLHCESVRLIEESILCKAFNGERYDWNEVKEYEDKTKPIFPKHKIHIKK